MAVRSKSNGAIRLRRWRVNALLLAGALIMARIVWQLGTLQVAQHAELSARARAEIDRTVTIQPSRGTIRDRAGNVLALDADRQSLFVVPSLIDQKEAAKLALVLAGLTGEPAAEIQLKLIDTEHYWLPIKRWLPPEIGERIAALNEPGLRLIYEPRRVYPQGAFAAHAIGAVNFEGVGISGVEGFYDTELKGITGTVTAEWDPQGNPIWLDPPQTRPARDGADLELTLDPFIQHVVERELKRAVDAHQADSGTVIVLEPKTGAIRAMASLPTFDPNRYNTYPAELYNQNPAIGRVYEPGSTFKIATVAIGLQTKAFTTTTEVNDTGVIERYGQELSNWNSGGNGMLTPAQVLYFSSNVGALQLNELTGPERFYRMVKAFGYGQPTGVDMAGESPGIVKDPNAPDFSPIDLLTNAYGQGIAVTPLQQVRMVAMIGNDGRLMRPYIVQRRCHAGQCEETRPQQVGQPVSPTVARQVRAMLIDSANHYAPVVWAPVTGDYGDAWLVPGYKVAAKTGTSTVPDGQGGFEDWTIGSVVGLVPAEQPQFAVLVKIDHPKDDIWGVSTAIPVYQAIARELVRYARITPDRSLVSDGQSIGGPRPS